ncbi:MAG: NAD(P)H-quinone oxidoreductase subunit 3 [Chloroflexi bacterium]|nr:NAD(P)H-quinone oxidoreductase subunit 3 [Chloroflexota bacterium]
MLVDYVPILILLFLSTALAVIALLFPTLLGPKRPTPTKLEPYESGLRPFSLPRRRFPVHYYMVAILFVLFDIEVLFLYPWAVLLRRLRWFGIIEMAVFLGILLVGYIYAWRKGGLDWL